MTQPQVTVGLVTRRADELLMVRRGHGAAGGTWGLPGGVLQGGETLAEAVVRHADAQAGVEALCGPFMGWTEDVESSPPKLWMCFEAVTLDEHSTPSDPEVAEHEWVHLEVVAERRLDEGLADFLAEHDVIDTVV